MVAVVRAGRATGQHRHRLWSTSLGGPRQAKEKRRRARLWTEINNGRARLGLGSGMGEVPKGWVWLLRQAAGVEGSGDRVGTVPSKVSDVELLAWRGVVTDRP